MTRDDQERLGLAPGDAELRLAHAFRRRLKGLILTGLSTAAAALAIAAFVAVIGYVLMQGAAGLSLSLFTAVTPPPNVEGGGIGNAVLGTFELVAVGLLISLPLSLLTAVYQVEYANHSVLSRWVDSSVYVLSTTPSIIVGLFAYATIVLTTGSFSILAGSFALALVMLPILIRATEEALRAVPDELRQGSLALGASHVQTVLHVVLPAALPSITTGVILAVARASGESAPLIFTALFSQYWSVGLLKPSASLSVLVYNFALSPFHNQQTLAWSAALVLVVLVMAGNIVARVATRKRRPQR